MQERPTTTLDSHTLTASMLLDAHCRSAASMHVFVRVWVDLCVFLNLCVCRCLNHVLDLAAAYIESVIHK